MRNWTMRAAAVGTLVAGSPALAQSVNVDANPAANFAGYRTYAWTVGTPAANPLAEQRLHALVDQQLAAKGFSKATATPDVFIATHLTTKEQHQLNVSGFGGWGYGFGGSTTTTVQTYVVGTLIVDIYDAKTDKNTAKANKALVKMFKQFPPTWALGNECARHAKVCRD